MATDPEEAIWVVRAQCGDRESRSFSPSAKGASARAVRLGRGNARNDRRSGTRFCLALVALFQEAAAAASDPGFLKALYVASTVQMLFMAACTAFVTFRVSRTTKAILRMIDLSRSRESKST